MLLHEVNLSEDVFSRALGEKWIKLKIYGKNYLAERDLVLHLAADMADIVIDHEYSHNHLEYSNNRE